MMENLSLKLFLFSSRFARSSINLALMLRTPDTWDTTQLLDYLRLREDLKF